MSKPVLLWVDLTLKKSHEPTLCHFDEFFAIRRADNRTDIADNDARPDALCFDFDFPDRASLELLEETKRRHPSIPLLMLTVQHSEELAVWAFRARVWDYFAKPVKREDVKRCHDSLTRIGYGGEQRLAAHITPPLPAENRVAGKGYHHLALLPATAYVESHFGGKITQSEVAALCGMSIYRFSRAFHAVFRKTFQDYLLSFRVDRAIELLKNPEARVSDVAHLVGFSDVSYFGRVFRRFYNMTPSQWQAAWRGSEDAVERPALRLELAYPEDPFASSRSRTLSS